MGNKNHHLDKAILFFLFFFVVSIAQAQEMVVLEKRCKYSVKVISGKLSITNNYQSAKLFYKNANRHSRDYVFYSSLAPLVEIDAYTKVPTDKGKYKTYRPKVYETKDIVEPGIFYGGHKVKEFVYPNVIPNSIGYFSYTKTIKDPHIIGSFYFDDRYDVKESEFSVTTTTDVNLEFDLFNTEGYVIEYKKEEIKNEIVHTWTGKDLKKAIKDDQGPSRTYHSPHIIMRVKNYKSGNDVKSVADDVEDLYNWYNSLLARMPKSDEAALESFVKELTDSLDSPEQKIEYLYSWVQSNIKYVAFEDGMAGFIPRAAGDVYAKKYGDCKDMANLLKTMLDMADIPAYLTWVGTNSKPYSYIDVPCTLTDNHMICATFIYGDYSYLDPTNPHLQFKMTPKLIQGKEALIKTGEKTYVVDTIPITDQSKNTRLDKLQLKIEDDALVGEVETRLTGYLIEDIKYNLIKDEYKNRPNSIQEYLSIGTKTTSVNSIESESQKSEYNLKFNARFENELIKAGNKMYVNMNLDPSDEQFQIKDIDTRSQEIQSNFKFNYVFQSQLQIPSGYSIDYIPEDQTYENEKFSMNVSYVKNGNSIEFNKTIVSNYLMLEPAYFEEYKEFYSEILKSKKQKVTLIKSE